MKTTIHNFNCFKLCLPMIMFVKSKTYWFYINVFQNRHIYKQISQKNVVIIMMDKKSNSFNHILKSYGTFSLFNIRNTDTRSIKSLVSPKF